MTHPLSNDGKLELAGKVGNDLVQHFGKKKYYSKAMINAAARRRGIAVSFITRCRLRSVLRLASFCSWTCATGRTNSSRMAFPTFYGTLRSGLIPPY